VTPNKRSAEGAGFAFLFRAGRQWPGATHRDCSAGAGVKSVVAVDFRNGMIDGVLKQHC